MCRKPLFARLLCSARLKSDAKCAREANTAAFDKIKKRKNEKMTVTKETLIGDILDFDVETAKFFFEIGMHCLGCPHSRGESIAEACEVHGTNADELVAKINEYLASKK